MTAIVQVKYMILQVSFFQIFTAEDSCKLLIKGSYKDNDILSDLKTIKQPLDTYKEIIDSIEVKIPNKLVEKTSPDIVETINKKVN